MSRINIYRKQHSINDTKTDVNDTKIDTNDAKVDANDTKVDTNDTKNNTPDTNTNDTALDIKKEIVKLMEENPTVTQKIIAEKCNVSISTVKRMILFLQENGTIKREGARRSGRWIVVK